MDTEEEEEANEEDLRDPEGSVSADLHHLALLAEVELLKGLGGEVAGVEE